MKKRRKKRGFYEPPIKNKIIIQLIGMIYVAILLLLLFWRTKYAPTPDYWTRVGANIQIVPFGTLRHYWKIIFNSNSISALFNALLNLAGNVAIFIPLGMVLPYENTRLRSSGRFFLWAVIIIAAVELTQLFTLRGVCDVDDLILNVIGEEIGFMLFTIFERIRKD